MRRSALLPALPLLLTLATACRAPQPARLQLAAPAAASASDPEITRDVALATFDSAWGTVRRTYYDSTFKGLDWNAVRRELRPRAERANTHAELRDVVRNMLERLGESHMTVLPQEFGGSSEEPGPDGRIGGVGIEARIVDSRLLVWRVAAGSPAERAGVRPGWIVQRIGDTDPDSAIAALRAVRDVRLRRTLTVQVTARLQSRFEGAPASRIAASFVDARGSTQSLVMQRDPIPGTPVKLGIMPTFVVSASSWRIPNTPVANSCVGVVRFNYWLVPVMQELASAMPALGACAGIVLDLRGNVGGLAAMLSGVSGFLVDSTLTLALVKSRGQEIRYDVFPRRADASGNRLRPYDGPIAILVDGLTVSTSEIFAAAMRHVTGGRTRLFGERTAGQALPALASRLPSGDVLMHVIGDLRLSDGARIEGAGVRPDVELPLRRADLLARRDAAMEAALLWIGQQPRRPARGLAG